MRRWGTEAACYGLLLQLLLHLRSAVSQASVSRTPTTVTVSRNSATHGNIAVILGLDFASYLDFWQSTYTLPAGLAVRQCMRAMQVCSTASLLSIITLVDTPPWAESDSCMYAGTIFPDTNSASTNYTDFSTSVDVVITMGPPDVGSQSRFCAPPTQLQLCFGSVMVARYMAAQDMPCHWAHPCS